eukprot:symbB.v1.2.027320.t1/scaffold2796.1/size70111/2
MVSLCEAMAAHTDEGATVWPENVVEESQQNQEKEWNRQEWFAETKDESEIEEWPSEDWAVKDEWQASDVHEGTIGWDEEVKDEWKEWKDESDGEMEDEKDEPPRKKKRKNRPSAKPSSLISQVGLDLMAFPPKDAVRRFFNRYTGKPATADDYFYRCEKTTSGKQVHLVTPSFYNRIYTSVVASTQKDAEISAAEAFRSDPDVQAAAARLAPPMKTLRQFSEGAGAERRSATGGNIGETKRQAVERLFSHFRDGGCRNWFDDGNA